MLQSKNNRQALDQIRDDASSLIVLYDAASFSSSTSVYTTASSQLSRRFPGLDDMLMRTPTYQNAFRSLIRRKKNSKSEVDHPSFHNTELAEQQATQGKEVWSSYYYHFPDPVRSYALLMHGLKFEYQVYGQDLHLRTRCSDVTIRVTIRTCSIKEEKENQLRFKQSNVFGEDHVTLLCSTSLSEQAVTTIAKRIQLTMADVRRFPHAHAAHGAQECFDYFTDAVLDHKETISYRRFERHLAAQRERPYFDL